MPLRLLTVNGRYIVGDDAAGVVVSIDLEEDTPGFVEEGSPAKDYIVFPHLDRFTLSASGVGSTAIYGSHDYDDGPRPYVARFTAPDGRSWSVPFFMPDSNWTLDPAAPVVPPTPIPVPTAGRGWCAWSTDNIFTEAEVLAGGREAANGGHAPIPDRSGMFQYFGLWLPGSAWSGVTGVFFSEAGQPMNTFNQITTLESAVSLTVDGVAGQIRVTTNARGRATIGGTVFWE